MNLGCVYMNFSLDDLRVIKMPELTNLFDTMSNLHWIEGVLCAIENDSNNLLFLPSARLAANGTSSFA